MSTVFHVPRNDLAAAAEFYRRNRPVTPSDMEALYMLQDDPAEFLEMSKDWETYDPAANAIAHNERYVRELIIRRIVGSTDD